MRFRDSDASSVVLVALADGMGGMRDGGQCAAMVLARFFADFASSTGKDYESRLLAAVLAANRTVHERFSGGGGATLSAILATQSGKIFAVNVGDSRIYRFGWRLLQQLTTDDTLAGQLNRKSEGIGSNELLQFVGIGREIEPHVFETENDFGTTGFLLTSDGVHFLPKESMEAVMSHAPEPPIGMKRLVDLAKWSGGHDNASAALVLAPPAPISDLADDAYLAVEVWDPFGDVQCVIFAKQPPKVVVENSRIVPPTPKVEKVATKKSRAPRKQKNKTSPAMRQEKDSGAMGGTGTPSAEVKGEDKPNAPQLIIDFPNKSSGR
ncbi:hypothetical protein G3N92_07020 [Burkholderia sp. Ac-20379]|nr:hypothetical protein [Burkholderia sp. Ac-20379]